MAMARGNKAGAPADGPPGGARGTSALGQLAQPDLDLVARLQRLEHLRRCLELVALAVTGLEHHPGLAGVDPGDFTRDLLRRSGGLALLLRLTHRQAAGEEQAEPERGP